VCPQDLTGLGKPVRSLFGEGETQRSDLPLARPGVIIVYSD
jgi:hypothetical protein